MGEHTSTEGLIDLQVNGFDGIDFNDEDVTADGIDHALLSMLSTGVTTCLPTIITASVEQLHDRLKALDHAIAKSQYGALMVPGYHLEGPFLNPSDGYAGCHPAKHMIAPSIEVIESLEKNLSRPILYLTLAPELAGAGSLISWASNQHKIVGIGHSAITGSELDAAIDNGVQVSTHLGNGMPASLPKFDNSMLLQLSDDRIMSTFIADGVHIPKQVLKSFVRAKGVNRSILVTDAISAANNSPGDYAFAGITTEMDEIGVVTMPGSSKLAGSSLRMDQAIRNIVDWYIATFQEGVLMASNNPKSLLLPALNGNNINQNFGKVLWQEDYHPHSVTIDSFTWTNRS